MSSVEHQLNYAFNSTFENKAKGGELRLCASKQVDGSAFFIGELKDAAESALCLRQLAVLVGTRFFTPPAMLSRILRESDPVITVSRSMLRFEGFSACCGVYGRVDILPSGLAPDKVSPGTTNIDFNSDMRSLLSRFRGQDKFTLSVTAEEVQASSGSESVVEKKVQLPLRWIKGFAEVQAIQSDMNLALCLTKNEAIKFLRSLPKGKSKHAVWLVKSANTLRISHRPHPGAVSMKGLERLGLLADLANRCSGINVYVNQDNTISAWLVKLNHSHFTFVFSEEIWRGFSGEGRLLEKLLKKPNSISHVKSQLGWQDSISIEDKNLVGEYKEEDVALSLSHLAAQGHVGFDLFQNSYFHRELPFNLKSLEELNPRLKSAISIVNNNEIEIVEKSAEKLVAEITSADAIHHVEITKDHDKCTCPWYSKHKQSRGSCKHLLAARIKMEDDENRI